MTDLWVVTVNSIGEPGGGISVGVFDDFAQAEQVARNFVRNQYNEEIDDRSTRINKEGVSYLYAEKGIHILIAKCKLNPEELITVFPLSSGGGKSRSSRRKRSNKQKKYSRRR